MLALIPSPLHMQHYMQAIKDGDATFASGPAVSQLFAEEAVMVATDRQVFHGRGAIVRRLNQGVAQLVQMAGADAAAQLPAFELAGPAAGAGGAVVVMLKLRRGLQKMTFTLTFRFGPGSKIVHLQNTRS